VINSKEWPDNFETTLFKKRPHYGRLGLCVCQRKKSHATLGTTSLFSMLLNNMFFNNIVLNVELVYPIYLLQCHRADWHFCVRSSGCRRRTCRRPSSWPSTRGRRPSSAAEIGFPRDTRTWSHPRSGCTNGKSETYHKSKKSLWKLTSVLSKNSL